MVFRINKTKDFTIMSNHHLKNRNLTLKAKGLMSLMLSLPDDWDYSMKGLVSICQENGTAVKTALKELKDNGYLKITGHREESGKFTYEYNIYENPYIENQPTVPCIDYPSTEEPMTEEPMTENRHQLNTNKSITKKSNTNKLKVPTLEEVQEYIKEKNLNVNGKQFYDYFNEGNWIDSKGNKVKNWKQKLLTWNSYKQPKQEKANTLTRDFGKLNQFYMNNEE